MNLGKKTLAIFTNVLDEEVLSIQLGKKTVFVSALKLVSHEESEEELSTVLQSALDTLYNRLASSVIILTCLSKGVMATYLIVASSDKDECLYERDVAAGVIEALSNGAILASKTRSKDLVKALTRCLEGETGFFTDMLSSRNNDRIVPCMHKVGIMYSSPSIDIREIEELSSVFSKGRIRVGRIVGAEDIVVALTDEHVFRHVAIVGTTGSGKSTTASVIATEAARNGYAVIIVDWHGEYASLLTPVRDIEILYTNPLEQRIPRYMNFEEIVSRDPLAFIEILETGLELTPAQVHVLEEALNVLRARKIKGYVIDLVVDVVQSSPASARWYTESREALIRKLKPLTSQYLSIRWSRCEFVDLKNNSIVIFDVSGISNIRVRKVLSSLLIRSLGLSAQYNLAPKPILVIVDEAHNIFEKENPICSMIAEVRKWSMGFVVISQAPSMLAPIVMKNTNTKIIHALKSSQDVNIVLSNIVSPQKMIRDISMLKPGEAYVLVPEIAKPVKIKVDTSLLS